MFLVKFKFFTLLITAAEAAKSGGPSTGDSGPVTQKNKYD